MSKVILCNMKEDKQSRKKVKVEKQSKGELKKLKESGRRRTRHAHVLILDITVPSRWVVAYI